MSDQPQREQAGYGFWLFAALHLLCCGIPLLVLSGVSLTTLWERGPWLAGVMATVGVIGFIWYLKRGCATCHRNEGRCRLAPQEK